MPPIFLLGTGFPSNHRGGSSPRGTGVPPVVFVGACLCRILESHPIIVAVALLVARASRPWCYGTCVSLQDPRVPSNRRGGSSPCGTGVPPVVFVCACLCKILETHPIIAAVALLVARASCPWRFRTYESLQVRRCRSHSLAFSLLPPRRLDSPNKKSLAGCQARLL